MAAMGGHRELPKLGLVVREGKRRVARLLVSSKGSGEAIYRRGEGHGLGCRRARPAEALATASEHGRAREHDELLIQSSRRGRRRRRAEEEAEHH